MKTRTSKLFALAIMMIALSATALAQTGVTIQATAAATIVTPIAISKSADMNFGNVAVNNTAGTVVLPPTADSPTRTVTGGASLITASAGTVTTAKFTVTGETGYVYSVTLPSGSVTLNGTPSGTMTASTFVSGTATGNYTLASGTSTLWVGATLNVGASQTAGSYISGNFPVTVNYN